MLTKQHRFAGAILNPETRKTYKTHMCGLCHALGDGYGLPHRLLTSHEMILLNLLVTAQSREPAAITSRRCPLNPARFVSTNQDAASEFAAAVAVELAAVSLADDIQDSAGSNLGARLLKLLLGPAQRRALNKLAGLGFETEHLTQLEQQQTAAEQDEAQDAAVPTAISSARLFAMTARLAGNHPNQERLSRIGELYGTYLYLADAYRDYAQDLAGGQYNPLRRFSLVTDDTVTLSARGVAWLLGRFEQIQAEIGALLDELQLYRDKAFIKALICSPIDRSVEDLKRRRVRQFAFKKWGFVDVLKAATFLTPLIPLALAAGQFDPPAVEMEAGSMEAGSMEAGSMEAGSMEAGSGQPGQRRRGRGQDDLWCYACLDCSSCGGNCSGWDVSGCAGSDCSFCDGCGNDGWGCGGCGDGDCSIGGCGD